MYKSKTMKRVHIFVSGTVQGVCYRAETWRYARNLNLNGWVKNLRDGRVEAVFEGETDIVNEMIEWCKKGPVLASVTGIEVIEEPYLGNYKDFSIRY